MDDSGDEQPNSTEDQSASEIRTGARSKERPSSTTTAEKEKSKLGADNSGASGDDPKDSPFECNICLDVASDAVISMCGHLFCWPCLHQWMETRCQCGWGQSAVSKSGDPISLRIHFIPMRANGISSTCLLVCLNARLFGCRLIIPQTLLLQTSAAALIML